METLRARGTHGQEYCPYTWRLGGTGSWAVEVAAAAAS